MGQAGVERRSAFQSYYPGGIGSSLTPRDNLALAIQNVNREAELIARRRTALSQIITPTTPLGKLRHTVVNLPLLNRFADALSQTPLEIQQAELRASAHNLVGDVTTIVEAGRAAILHAQEIDKLISCVEANPEDRQAVLNLKDRLRQRADEELNLRMPSHVQMLLDEQMTPETPEEKEAERIRIMEEGRLHRQFAAPIVQTLETMIASSALTLDQVAGMYSLLSEYRGAIDTSVRTARHIVRGKQLGVSTTAAMVDQLKLANRLVELCQQADAIYDSACLVTSGNLLELQQEAETLSGKK